MIPKISMCILGFQDGSWDSMMDLGIPGWILGVQDGSWDSIVDPRIPVWVLILHWNLKIYDYSVDPGIPK